MRNEIELDGEITAEQLDELAKLLAEQEFDAKSALTDSKGKTIFENLETGLYLLKAKDTKSYGVISPVLIAVPTWDEVQKKMEYNVTVIPKHINEVLESVKTGDSEDLSVYLGVAGVSLLCIVYVSRKRKIYDRK